MASLRWSILLALSACLAIQAMPLDEVVAVEEQAAAAVIPPVAAPVEPNEAPIEPVPFSKEVRKVNAPAAAAPAAGKSGPLRICTWNVFRFGPTKFKLPDEFVDTYGKSKIDMMVEQINNADILALQEYFDPSLAVLNQLTDALSAKTGSKWAYAVGDRVGRTSQEQYVFLYRTEVAKVSGNATYPEPSDIFSREPFFANFKITKSGTSLKDITLGTIHTEPSQAVREMNGLIDSYTWAEKKFGSKDVMVLGDYNGDCQYVRKSDWPDVKLQDDNNFTWFIKTGVDTASMNSECTFDRAVVKHSQSPNFKNAYVPDSMKVLDFVTQYKIEVAKARQLSDHFPVCMQFK